MCSVSVLFGAYDNGGETWEIVGAKAIHLLFMGALESELDTSGFGNWPCQEKIGSSLGCWEDISIVERN